MDHFIRVEARVSKSDDHAELQIKTWTVTGEIQLHGELVEQVSDNEVLEIVIRKPE